MTKLLSDLKPTQYLLGSLIGFGFGFLLQKGGVCDYEVIMKQLLLQDFTVAKVILTAIGTGMVGIYAMRGAGWVELHKKSGSLGATLPGPLIFGIGFALLGYCPGTSVGAVGHGALDALVGGVIGIMAGAGLYAAAYPAIKRRILPIGQFGDKTLIDLLGLTNPWFAVVPTVLLIVAVLLALESLGF